MRDIAQWSERIVRQTRSALLRSPFDTIVISQVDDPLPVNGAQFGGLRCLCVGGARQRKITADFVRVGARLRSAGGNRARGIPQAHYVTRDKAALRQASGKVAPSQTQRGNRETDSKRGLPSARDVRLLSWLAYHRYDNRASTPSGRVPTAKLNFDEGLYRLTMA